MTAAGGGGRWISGPRCASEAWAPRVLCKQHGVVVAAVPWARHDAAFTRSFEDQTAWLAVNTSKSAICQLMRIAWRTVGRICERVSAEARAGRDLFQNLTELGFEHDLAHLRARERVVPSGQRGPQRNGVEPSVQRLPATNAATAWIWASLSLPAKAGIEPPP